MDVNAHFYQIWNVGFGIYLALETTCASAWDLNVHAKYSEQALGRLAQIPDGAQTPQSMVVYALNSALRYDVSLHT